MTMMATESGGLDTHADWDRCLAQAGFFPSEEIEMPQRLGRLIADRRTKAV
jgi:hypothetical protein